MSGSGGGVGRTSVDRALRLLNAFGRGRAAESLTYLAESAGLPKSTARRMLRSMEAAGFVARRGTLYRLGPRMAELGRLAESPSRPLHRAAEEPLGALFDEVRTTVHLAVLSGENVSYVEKITAPGGTRIPTRVGIELPARRTALGKAQLAFAAPPLEAPEAGNPEPGAPEGEARLAADLRRTRARGFATDHEEFRAGLSCVAAPVVVGGATIAAVSVSSMADVATTGPRRRAVIAAAARVAANLTAHQERP